MSLSVRAKRKHRRKRLRILIAGGSVFFILLLGFLVDSAMYYNKVHAGVTVCGRSISGLTREDATHTLTKWVQEASKKPITLTSGAKSWPVLPDDVGTKIDVAAAITEAMDASRGRNFLVDCARRFFLHFGDENISLQGTVDTGKMDEALAAVAEDLDVAPVDPGLTIHGTEVKAVEGQKGRVVDRAALRQQLMSLLLTLHSTKLEVPMVIKEPAMKAEDSRQAVSQVKTMIGSSVTLAFNDASWKLTSEQVAAYMDFTVDNVKGVATLVPYLSATKMDRFLKDVAGQVDKRPVNAGFKGDGEKAWVVPAIAGRKLDPVKTAEALTVAALKTKGRTAKVVTTVVEPDRTTEEAEAMGIEERLGTFTTEWIGTEDRQTNVRITTEYASNVILAPGEVYDFDKQVGPRTAERGYKEAPGIIAGKLEDQFGGGICQVSTTLFNAVFLAGLEVLERKNHSIYIDHYPKGRDATVSADGPNFRFRNDTEHYVLVRGASNGVSTTFVIYGSKDGRTVEHSTSEFYDVVEMEVVNYNKSALGVGTTEIKTAGQDGKGITVKRIVKAADGTTLHTDEFVSTWKMIPHEVYVGIAKPTTTTAKPTTSTTKPKPTTTTTKPKPTTTATTGF